MQMCVRGHAPTLMRKYTHRWAAGRLGQKYNCASARALLLALPTCLWGITSSPGRPHTPVWKEQVRQLFPLGNKALWLFGAGGGQGRKSRKTFTTGYPHVEKGAGNEHPFTQNSPTVQ